MVGRNKSRDVFLWYFPNLLCIQITLGILLIGSDWLAWEKPGALHLISMRVKLASRPYFKEQVHWEMRWTILPM